jgi:hypothetical protein
MIERWHDAALPSNDSKERFFKTEFELVLPYLTFATRIALDTLYEFRIYVADARKSTGGVESSTGAALSYSVSPLRFFIVEQGNLCNRSLQSQEQARAIQSISDTESPRPFVSIIFPGTNDSPQFLLRVCLMLSTLTQFIAARNISAEIIVVDWASNAASPSFGALIAQQCLLFWPVRVVVVPPQLMEELRLSYYERYPSVHDDIAQLHVLSELAKNVGARRAHGDFLVFINGDTIIHPALLWRLRPNTLRKGYVYRAARWELDVGDSAYLGSGLSPDVAQLFEEFQSNCNIAPGKFFHDLSAGCWQRCLPSGHCFALDPRHACIATDTAYSPWHHCPNPRGFEDFCNNGVHPELSDPDFIFTDASGVQCELIDDTRLTAQS